MDGGSCLPEICVLVDEETQSSRPSTAGQAGPTQRPLAAHTLAAGPASRGREETPNVWPHSAGPRECPGAARHERRRGINVWVWQMSEVSPTEILVI